MLQARRSCVAALLFSKLNQKLTRVLFAVVQNQQLPEACTCSLMEERTEPRCADAGTKRRVHTPERVHFGFLVSFFVAFHLCPWGRLCVVKCQPSQGLEAPRSQQQEGGHI